MAVTIGIGVRFAECLADFCAALQFVVFLVDPFVQVAGKPNLSRNCFMNRLSKLSKYFL